MKLNSNQKAIMKELDTKEKKSLYIESLSEQIQEEQNEHIQAPKEDKEESSFNLEKEVNERENLAKEGLDNQDLEEVGEIEPKGTNWGLISGLVFAGVGIIGAISFFSSKNPQEKPAESDPQMSGERQQKSVNGLEF